MKAPIAVVRSLTERKVPQRMARSSRPIHHRGARTHDHLQRVFGIASRTRPRGATSDRIRHDQLPAAYALVRGYFRWRRQVLGWNQLG